MENEHTPEELKASDDYINKRFFGYMKDGMYWYSSQKPTGECNYHNPLNGVAYGLCFHKDDRWLEALEARVGYNYHIRGFTFFTSQRVMTIEEDNELGYCLHGFIAKYPGDIPRVVGHAHGNTLFQARKLLLLDVVETCISILN
jgi:hypothetical protein